MKRELVLIELAPGYDYMPIVFIDNGEMVFEQDSTHFNGYADYVEGYCNALGETYKRIGVETKSDLEKALKAYPKLVEVDGYEDFLEILMEESENE